MIPKTLLNRKSSWLRRINKVEAQIEYIIEEARRHSRKVRTRDIRAVNNRLHVLGAYGEELWRVLGDAGASSEMLGKIGDRLSDIQDLSEGILAASKKILGFEMRAMQPFYSTVVRGKVRTESQASKSLDEFNGNEDNARREETT